MSIVISNISDEYSRTGIQQYEVCLNRIQLCTFTHLSEDGMAVCLVKAAKALAEVNIDERIAEYKTKEAAAKWLENNTTRIWREYKND